MLLFPLWLDRQTNIQQSLCLLQKRELGRDKWVKGQFYPPPFPESQKSVSNPGNEATACDPLEEGP